MKSALPKVLHPVGGRTLLGHALHAAREAAPQHLSVVVRHERERVAAHVAEVDPAALVADQDEIKGTGRAAECGLEVLPGDLTGTVIVTMGDVPLLAGQTLTDLTAAHESAGAAVTVITAELEDPTGYGRIVRDADGSVRKVMEHKDALAAREAGGEDADVLDLREINSGIWAFDAAVLREHLPNLGTDNSQGEKYLTDVLQLAREAGGTVAAHRIDDAEQISGVNNRAQLSELGAEMNRRIVRHWQLEGVTVVDPASTWIDVDVTLGRDVVIRPNTQLLGACTIGDDVVLGPDTTLTDVEVGAGASVVRTHGELSTVGEGATVGPFAYLRPNTVLGRDAKIGTFVETKNSEIGVGTKVPHLTYVGDAEIGDHSNIGASSVFVNYDGVTKSRTHIGNHCRTGSDTMFIAPVTVGDGAYTGAGTVVRKDVPAGALAITVAPQKNIEGWVRDKRAGTASAEAAQAADEVARERSSEA